MSLNWNIKNCKDHETLQSDTEWPITHNLIWATMSVGIGEITETNWQEFYGRISAWEDAVGSFSQTKDKNGNYKSHPFTPEDIYKRIGLHTNAASMSRAEWEKSIGRYFSQKADANKRCAIIYEQKTNNPKQGAKAA